MPLGCVFKIVRLAGFLRVGGRKRMLRILMSVWLLIAAVIVTAGQNAPASPSVDVELEVRGPDGSPAARAKILVEIKDRGTFDPKVEDIRAETDAQGVARFKAPPGAYRTVVRVRGVGRGDIGITEFAPGRVVRPQMPPLVAYGSMDGTYPVEACPPNSKIEAAEGYTYDNITVAPDSPGHFHIDDAVGGFWSITASDGKKTCARSQVELRAGQNLNGLRLIVPEAPQEPPPVVSPAPRPAPANERSREPVLWVSGTVRDESGQPVAGASVMALATFQGAIRMYQVTSQAVTDSVGRYQLKGEGGLPYFSATLIVKAPGHPPAWAWPSFPQFSSFDRKPMGPTDPPTQDFILPSHGGRLEVTVVRHGEAVPGITVALYLENANLRDMWARPMGDASAVQDAAYPMAQTNSAGVASFKDLSPGSYHILATASVERARNSLYGLHNLEGNTAESIGVSVRVGEITSYRLNLWEQQNATSLRVQQPDGKPFTGNAAVAFGPPNALWWNSSRQFDASGSTTTSFDRAGLWQMQVMYRDVPVTSIPIREPYYLAPGYLAASALLDRQNVPSFTARRIEPGSARIRVQDVNGRPLHVTVLLIATGGGGRTVSATTDDQGEVLFSGLPSGAEYYVNLEGTPQTEVKTIAGGKFLVRPVGVEPAVKDPDLQLGKGGEIPMPKPEEMLAEPGVLQEIFVARANTETRILMRAQSLTYVYGIIKRPAGQENNYWGVGPDFPLARHGVDGRSRISTGEYIIGPFPPGEHVLHFGSGTQRYHTTITVVPAQHGPIRFDIDPDKYEPEPTAAPTRDPLITEPETVVMGMGGISSRAGGARGLVGKVYLADGTTPAYGAQVLYFPAHQAAPALFAMTDAQGMLQPRGLWRTGLPNASVSGPDTPVVLAFLPGSHGAVVQTSPIRANEPLRLVLPHPIAAAGRVTVAGASPSGLPATIRVMAAAQNRGFLNPYLSIVTTADADGKFNLSGLTEGDYLVQAALDNIWLSQPVPLHASTSSHDSIGLNIPAPGVPVLLHLYDAAGKPVANATTTVEHSGPMADLWPHDWTSDGAGTVYIPTLEAGRHLFQVQGAGTVRIQVPPRPGRAIEKRVVIWHPEVIAAKKIGAAARYDPK